MGTRAAMYIDFDNFFGGLIAADPGSAVEVATNPSTWLERLTHEHSDDGTRRWLALRCYMNPAGSVANPRVENDRLYFSKFRPYFVRAGFEVVDCPTLARGKNAADIRIVIDVMTALQGPARIDEFVLASSDADFTPLLHVVRAHDRKVTMIATGETASAYETLADRLLDAAIVVDLLTPDSPDPSPAEEVDTQTTPPAPNIAALKGAFTAAVTAEYNAATEPLVLARLATRLATHLGPELRASNWLNHGTFLRAVRSLNLPNVAFYEHYMWDTTRHAPPEQSVPVTDLPPEIAKFSQLVGLPRIPHDDWPRVFHYLEEYGKTQEFSLSEASKWPRDRAAEAGHSIARAVFTYVLTACHSEGTRLDVEEIPTADILAEALLGSVLSRADLAGLEVTLEDSQRLRTWLGLSRDEVTSADHCGLLGSTPSRHISPDETPVSREQI